MVFSNRNKNTSTVKIREITKVSIKVGAKFQKHSASLTLTVVPQKVKLHMSVRKNYVEKLTTLSQPWEIFRRV